MRLQNLACAACAALALACGASADEKVKLEYKLKPGTELVYKLSGTIKMTAQGNGPQGDAAISGTERYVVAEADEKTGVMLIGQAPDLKVIVKEIGPQGGNDHNEDFVMATACRMDRAGNPVLRKPKDADNPQPEVSGPPLMMDHLQLDPAALPAGEVAVGATWESATDAPLHGIPEPFSVKLASTLTEIKVVDGHKCAVIKSKVSTGDPPANGRRNEPDLDVTGEIETLFDIEAGCSRSVKTKLEIKVDGGAEDVTVETNFVLDSSKALPAEEAARMAKLVRALDDAGASVALGKYEEAAAALDKLFKEADLPAWKAGIAVTAVQIESLAVTRRQRQGPPSVPAEELFADGQKAMDEQNWADAVAKFKELAEKYPNDPRTPDALTAAAAVCENRLNDAKSADELRKKAAALKEKK